MWLLSGGNIDVAVWQEVVDESQFALSVAH